MSSPTQFVAAPKSVIANPSADELRQLVAEMPNAKPSEYGNYNVETKVVARSKASTYIVTDTPEKHTDQTISRAKGAEIARLQDDYIKNQSMIVIDGFIGCDEEYRVPARLMIERKNANIAAMQRQLYFDPTPQELANFEPQLMVVYTPNLQAAGFPNDRVIAVDLENNITRVLNSDYFGESKKGGLRMWNRMVYERGGLPMHAGCKMIPVGNDTRTGLIIGLSGTGKTTTTFTQQNGSMPVQDDFVGLLPKGKVMATEDGCFAKTYGLSKATEPEIYEAVTGAEAYMENVSMNDAGKVNFSDDTYTQNGRATFPFRLIPNSADARSIERVDFILILNRNENIIPAVARLSQEQAAAYFMLGETKGTSAGGVEEAGKALRVPGTNPFFPLQHALQGTRFLELLRTMPDLKVYLMNTGWVGGPAGTPHSLKVKIRHSSAVVKGVAEDTIQWVKDPDFGYEVAASVPGLEQADQPLLQPKKYYASTERQGEYDTFVRQLKSDRVAHLRNYDGLTDEIIMAVG